MTTGIMPLQSCNGSSADRQGNSSRFVRRSREAVRECETVVAVMGINKSIEREGQDRYDIQLPADQREFLQEIYKVNPNIIVVLVAGSSLAINWMDEHIPAIVNAWYPGEQGGTAVAEVLFGDYNPAGRLPLTYYKSLDELLRLMIMI